MRAWSELDSQYRSFADASAWSTVELDWKLWASFEARLKARREAADVSPSMMVLVVTS